LLRGFAPSWLTQMPSLLKGEESERLQKLALVVTQQRMLREMAEALEALATESPLVLLLEDLHWSDFSTLELISAVSRRTEPERLLGIGSYRPVDVIAKDHPLRAMKQELEIHRNCEELRLRLLREKDTESCLTRRIAGEDAHRFASVAPI